MEMSEYQRLISQLPIEISAADFSVIYLHVTSLTFDIAEMKHSYFLTLFVNCGNLSFTLLRKNTVFSNTFGESKLI